MIATIDHDGRIALADELQAELGVHPGDDVLLEKRGDEWIIKAANAQTGLCDEGNVLVHRGVSAAPMEDPVAKIRDERFGQLCEGLPQ